LQVEPLLTAASEAESFPRPTSSCIALASRARLILRVREALLKCIWEEARTWKELLQVTEAVSAEVAAEELEGAEELQEIRSAMQEFDDMQSFTELRVKVAMASGSSLKDSHGRWDHSSLSVLLLKETLQQLEEFPQPSMNGKKLAKEASVIIQVREALALASWSSAASWAPLSKLLDGLPAEAWEFSEVDSARGELFDKRTSLVKILDDAMGKNQSRRKDEGLWDHSELATEAIEKARSECADFPKRTPEMEKLMACAAVVVSVRSALLRVEREKPSTWTIVLNALHAVELPEHQSLPEVKAAWLEFRETRNRAVEDLKMALKAGHSRPVGKAKRWDHDGLDSETLARAIFQLETFPKIDSPSTSADKSRNSASNPRRSMISAEKAADSLVVSAKSIVKLRELLKGNEWAELHRMLQQVERNADRPHELVTDELRRASQELEEMAVIQEEALMECLKNGRSVRRPTSLGGGWDHSKLSTQELLLAADALRAFPLQRPTAAPLLKNAAFVSSLRDLLKQRNWARLKSVLDSCEPELRNLEEAVAAASEFEETRQLIEDELSSALVSGRSLKQIGKKTMLSFADKSYVVDVTWDHSGLKDGMERLSAAVAAAEAFPQPSGKSRQLVNSAALSAKIRKIIYGGELGELRTLFATVKDKDLLRTEEVEMAWQEYLCMELERATKKKDQAALKEGLALAAAHGMLPVEKPMHKALEVFIDPPQIIHEPYPEAIPGPDGRVHIEVTVRNATSLQWVKNGIALKEGADGGRIMGVHKPELIITHLLGRDKDQKVWCVAKNKWGSAQTQQVILRVPGSLEQDKPSVAVTAALGRTAAMSMETSEASETKSIFGSAMAAVRSVRERSVSNMKGRSTSNAAVSKQGSSNDSRSMRSGSILNDGDRIDEASLAALNGLRRADGSIVDETHKKTPTLVSTGL